MIVLQGATVDRARRLRSVNRVDEFVRLPHYEKLNKLRSAYHLIKTKYFYRLIFGSMGSGCMVRKPASLQNTRFIHLGDRVIIGQGVRLNAVVDKPSRVPELRIGSNVNIEQNVHIICHSKIRIGDNVSITGHCAIVDTTHPYQDIHDPRPIGSRILDEESFVEIGDGSFIGFGAIVMPNVRIGKYCVIGAHACVTKDIPDYSVAVGNPALIIRHYDEASGSWAREEVSSSDARRKPVDLSRHLVTKERV
jgi:acetyltransferase-like isoleucine patch superfamily enzyme